MFHKKLKTALILSLALTSFGAFSAPSFAAGYTLNPEVKDATPALKKAAEIGVRTYNNPDMQNEANKEGVTVPTPEQAMAQLKKEGYTRVAITSLDIIPGMEYAYDTAIFDLYKHDFKKLTLGTPLMYWMGQEDQRDDIAEFVKAFSTQFPKIGKKDAILVMAHGTPHPANAYYSVVQNLMPMRMGAGDHANNDMAGADADSHKSILEKEGFTVTTYIHGLGENEAVRQMFVERADEAWNALEAQ